MLVKLAYTNFSD